MTHHIKMKGQMMFTLKKPFIAVAALATLCSGIPTNSFALASNDSASYSQSQSSSQNLSKSDEDSIRADFNKYSVPKYQQDNLINKLRSGQAFDAFTNRSNPVSVENSANQTIKRYADGSYIATTLASADAVTTGKTASSSSNASAGSGQLLGCQISSGTGYRVYRNCSVSGSWSGVVNVTFLATSFEILQNGVARINGVGKATQKCAGVQCTTPTVTLVRKQEDSNGPAYAFAQTHVNTPFSSWEAWVELDVSAGGPSVHTS